MQGPQAGTIIFVHLDTRKIEQIRPPSGLQQKYLGGRGVGVHLVSEQVDPQIDACDPANILVFSAGLFTGTGLPFGARYDLVTKSPLTGTLSSSNSGGVFGSALKRTGIDALVLSGASPEPVYLWITGGGAEICDANDYWGMTTRECNRALLRDRQEPEVKVACIGPAGEHLCRFASVMNDASRAAGRGGAGAVMGAKKVKAVVVRSEKRRERISPGMRGALEIAKTSIEKSGIARGSLHRYGTSSMVNLVNEAHLLPVRNFQESHAPSAENFSGEEIEQSILTGRITCYACPVACGRLTAIAGHQGEGPEFETIWAFGPDCGIDNLSTITAANYLCNDLGLDTISAGATIACAMELMERGHIREGPRFGDEDRMLALIEDIAYRHGMGDELAEGSFRFASRHGHPEISMSVKMMEIPAYDPRGMQGQGLEYATSVRGACHVYGNIRYPELLGIPFRLDPQSNESKAYWVKHFQDLSAVIDSLGICIFTLRIFSPADYAAITSHITGYRWGEEELLRVGERIWNVQKLFNQNAGFSRRDDTLPARLTQEGYGWKKEPILSEYYALRGWDGDGVPDSSTLERLEIHNRMKIC